VLVIPIGTPKASRESVPGMFDNLEVRVLCTVGGCEVLAQRKGVVARRGLEEA